MPTGDFFTIPRTVVIGGRGFSLRRPTVATVDCVFEDLAAEILALLKKLGQGGALLSNEVIAGTLARTVPAKFERALRTCVTPQDGVWEPCPTADLVRELVSICDVDRILKGVLTPIASAAEGPVNPRASDHSLFFFAQEAGVSVVELVNEWPYEAYLALRDVIDDRIVEREAKAMNVTPEYYRLLKEMAAQNAPQA